MTLRPGQYKDLMLAPVAAEIDLNLQRMRDRSAEDVEAQLELELDQLAMGVDRDRRAQLVLEQALRLVDLHGWNATITDDGWRLRLAGGSVSLDLGLSAGITAYIEEGIGAPTGHS